MAPSGICPVPILPLINSRDRKLVVCICRTFRSNVEYGRHSKELTNWNLVNRPLSRRKMNRRIQMRSVMLQHPETSREVAVLFDAGIIFGLEPPFIAGPRHQFVADGVGEV